MLSKSVSYCMTELTKSLIGLSDLKPVFCPNSLERTNSLLILISVFSTTGFLSISFGDN